MSYNSELATAKSQRKSITGGFAGPVAYLGLTDSSPCRRLSLCAKDFRITHAKRADLRPIFSGVLGNRCHG
jgi:hypothetical protein